MTSRSVVSISRGLIIFFLIDPKIPVHGPSLFAMREVRPAVQPRQPAPIVPRYQTEAYLAEYARHVDQQSHQAQPVNNENDRQAVQEIFDDSESD